MREVFSPPTYSPTLSLRVFSLLLATALLPSAADAAGHGEPGPVQAVEIILRDRPADLKTLVDLGIDLDGVFFDRARAYIIEEEREKLELLGFRVRRIPEELLVPGLSGG